jgi:chemotaxis protein MotA
MKMIKGFGYFCLFVFFVLCTQTGGFAMGFAIWFLSVLLVAAGAIGFACVQFPKELEEGVLKRLLQSFNRDIAGLVKEIETLSSSARKDGLLSLEALRKELKDPFLSYLVKRVIGGFEKGQINGVVHNQFMRAQELFTITQNYVDRVLQLVPVVGLIGTLAQIMDFLNHGTGSLAAAFIPFVVSLIVQLGLQAYALEKIIRSMDVTRLYFIILEEGVSGVQDAMNPELLGEKLRARLSENIKWEA